MDRSVLAGKRVALGVGGGIAAYKCCDLVRELLRAGATVRVAMTRAAQKFVTPLTLQALSGHPVLTETFDPTQEAGFGHLDLARWADLFVVAPATANLIARIRAGMADDGVTTSLLAFRGPVLVAPAMNTAMWENRLTQQNVATLLEDGRFQLVGPGVGALADGDVGAGRLADLGEVVDAAARAVGKGELSGCKVLITAGPTREPIDPVRFFSNPSTGKMGLAMAQVAAARGAQVTVVLGPVHEEEPRGVSLVRVTTAEQMAREVLSRVAKVDVLVAAAAVSDFRAKKVATQKIKKAKAPTSIELVRTPDVLAEASRKVRKSSRRPLLVGFAAETEKVIEHARQKLAAKGLDAIVANDVGAPGAGFGGDTNRVTLLWSSGERLAVAGTKHEVARRLWDALGARLASR